MYRMLGIGFSAGGFPLIKRILQALPKDYPLPIVIVAHLPGGEVSHLAEVLDTFTCLPVRMAADKEIIERGRIYIAPPDYHLLIERNRRSVLSFALSVDEPVRSVRPSIDVLFESAAEVFESDLIALLLSGANSDGVEGMACVKQLGGLGIVLDPGECEFSAMSDAAIRRVDVDYVASLDEIISLLLSVHEES
ncbi:MAG: chemotaxis protein CheB [Nitrosomonadales bacterium]|nr:chemotaxis protein CheB [Nitrosomonadales bacterium]